MKHVKKKKISLFHSTTDLCLVASLHLLQLVSLQNTGVHIIQPHTSLIIPSN